MRKEYELECIRDAAQLNPPYDAVVMAVAHKEFSSLDIKGLIHQSSTVFDIKGKLPREITDGRL